MNQEELIMFLAKGLCEIEQQNDEDFDINQEQYQALCTIIAYLKGLVNKCDGYIEPITLHPREQHAGITAIFTVLDFCGEDLAQLPSQLGKCSAICLDVMGDQVCLSITVPNVFVPKQQ